MLKPLKLSVITLFLLLLNSTACGGGGGGGSNDIWPGLWLMTATLSSNTCSFSPGDIGLGSFINPGYQINQSGNNIVAENITTKATLTGSTVDGGSAFFASRPPDPGSLDCANASDIASLGFRSTSSDEAEATLFLEFLCNGALNCEMIWDGTAIRQ